MDEVLRDLAGRGLIPLAGSVAEALAPLTEEELTRAILEEHPGFLRSGNPDVLPGLRAHSAAHGRQIAALLTGGALELGFVREHARLRAEQRFPLEMTLRAYQSGARVVGHWLLNVLHDEGAALDFAQAYTSAVSSAMVAEYVAHTRGLAEAEGDRRSELLSILLDGHDEADPRVADVLRRAGFLDQRQVYAVAVVRAAQVAEMENPARVMRIVAAIGDAMAPTRIRTLAGVRGDVAVAVLADRRRQSGWTAPESDLSERAEERLAMLGPSVIVGLSRDHPATVFVPKALGEAQVALGFADRDARLVRFGDLPLQLLLVHAGAGQVRATLPDWAARLAAEPVLLETLRAMAEADMNLQQAARRLGRHPNTVYLRVEKVKGMTGHDPLRFRGLSEILLTVDCLTGPEFRKVGSRPL
ncbi:MAG: helix-turn-helix domain-containing protein [Tabrizicola sp.]|nr:helix-turn-helix domain-containing protein [Tabrizicola sp.]